MAEGEAVAVLIVEGEEHCRRFKAAVCRHARGARRMRREGEAAARVLTARGGWACVMDIIVPVIVR